MIIDEETAQTAAHMETLRNSICDHALAEGKELGLDGNVAAAAVIEAGLLMMFRGAGGDTGKFLMNAKIAHSMFSKMIVAYAVNPGAVK